MFLPLLLTGSVSCKTTLVAWPFSGSLPTFPRSTSALKKYFEMAQTRAQIFMPYLSGFCGMYTLKGHLPLVGTNCSSTTISSDGVKEERQPDKNISQISLIGASLSVCLRVDLVSLLSKRKNFVISLNYSSDIVALTCSGPYFHRSFV